MVRAELHESLRPPSCCSVEVMKGAYGRRVYGFSSTRTTCAATPARPSASEVARGPSSTTTSRAPSRSPPVVSSKSRPVATRRPSTATSEAPNVPACSASDPVDSVAPTSQCSAERKRMRSRSRSTSTRVATDCTRPADRPEDTLRHRTGETS